MEKDEPSVSVSEAAKQLHYSTHHIHYLIKKRKLDALRVNHSLTVVSLASIEAFLAEHGERLVDPLEQVKERVSSLEQIVGDVLRQLAMVSTHMAKQDHKIAEIQSQMRAQVGHHLRTTSLGLPDGVEMLVDFARVHSVSVSKLRTLVEHDSSLATVRERPGAVRLKHQWLINLDQKARLLAAIQVKGITYTLCGDCPHTVIAGN